MPSSHLRDASEANRCVRNYQKHPVSRSENWNFACDINSASLHGNHSPSSAWKITPLTEYPYLNHKVFVRFKLQRISVWRTRRVLLHKFSIMKENARIFTLKTINEQFFILRARLVSLLIPHEWLKESTAWTPRSSRDSRLRVFARPLCRRSVPAVPRGYCGHVYMLLFRGICPFVLTGFR